MPFYIGTILPIVIIFIFNLVMYIFIIVSVCRRLRGASKSSNTKLSYRKLAWTAVVLSVVFGLGWCFGLAQTSVPQDSGDAARGTLFALQFLFSILVGSQGILMFIFYGLTNKKIREVWKRWFLPKRHGKFSFEFSSHSTSTMRAGYSKGSTMYSNSYATMRRSHDEKGELCKAGIKETSFDKELEKTDSMLDQKPDASENVYFEPEKKQLEAGYDLEDSLYTPMDYLPQSDCQKQDPHDQQDTKLEEHVYAVPDIEEPKDQKTTASSSETEEKLLSVVVLKNENAEEENVYEVPDVDDNIKNGKEPKDEKTTALPAPSETEEKLVSVVVLKNENAEEEHVYAVPDIDDDSKEPKDQKTTASPSENEEHLLSVETDDN